jgi:hypothetical protein
MATSQYRRHSPVSCMSAHSRRQLEASGKVLGAGLWTCWIHEILELYVVFFTSSPFTFIQVCNSSMAEVLQKKLKQKCFTTLNKTILVGTYPRKSLRFQSWNFIWVCLKIWSPIPRTIWQNYSGTHSGGFSFYFHSRVYTCTVTGEEYTRLLNSLFLKSVFAWLHSGLLVALVSFLKQCMKNITA